MKSKYAYPNILRKIYIRLHMKYCKLFHKKYIREYTAVFKYKNKIDYFINATGFNKRDCIEKVRDVVFNSGFFNGIKNKKDIQVLVIATVEYTYEELYTIY